MATGEKTRLTISQCTVSGGIASAGKSPAPFEAMINPTGYAQDYCLKYTTTVALGQAGNETKFRAALPGTLKLKELVLDGTGVVPGTTTAVKDQVAALKAVAYEYVGKEHEAPVVQVVWGELVFYGRITSLKVDYTLFKPSGEPLRAKVSIDLVKFVTAEQLAKEAGNSSPDLTHLVQVVAGDTLPLLCQRIYKDASYYPEVARFNGLTNFRQLQPGTQLRFPPLA